MKSRRSTISPIGGSWSPRDFFSSRSASLWRLRTTSSAFTRSSCRDMVRALRWRSARSTDFSAESGLPDDLIYGPLARLVLGKDSATINAFFISQGGARRQPRQRGIETQLADAARALQKRWARRRGLFRNQGPGTRRARSRTSCIGSDPCSISTYAGAMRRKPTTTRRPEPRQSGPIRVANRRVIRTVGGDV